MEVYEIAGDFQYPDLLAGHSNIATTYRYLKDSYSDLANVVEALPKY